MLHLTRRYKPADVAVRAEADVTADEDTTVGALLTFAFAALGETPTRLFNYGIIGRPRAPLADPLPAGSYTVFADRD